MRRVIVALIAGVTALLLSAPTAAPAKADVADATVERALPARPVSAKIVVLDRTTRGVKVKITGLAREWKGKPVKLQRRVGGTWKSIAKDRTNTRTRYNFVRFLTPGTYRFRVRVPKGNGYRVSYSPVVGGTVTDG
jgi:hypothetical protein